MNKPTKKIQQICAELGENYSITVIDQENVIYRDLGNYDFEISQLDNNRKKFNAALYVWRTDGGKRTVENIPDISSLAALKQILQTQEAKYLGLFEECQQ